MKPLGKASSLWWAIMSFICGITIAMGAATGLTAGWGNYTDPTGAIVYYWNDPLNVKFKYTTTRQWWDYSTTDVTWYVLSAAGSSGAFIGDGSWRDLGTGFIYSYSTTNDMAWFKKGVDGRFGYYYSPGRWMTTGNTGSWQYLGNAGLSANFLGDAAWHDLGNGFTYCYSSSSDLGWFKRTVGGGRFGYYYAPSQWMTTGNYGGWQYIGNAGLSASFLGDGAWHSLGNGFNYSYVTASDLGWFKVGTTGRFGYSYIPGQWMTTGNSGGWQFTGNAGLSASFLGDGAWHSLGNGFIYSYVAGSDMGWFKAGIDGRFGYYYALTRWITTGTYGGWQYIGNAGLSTSFLGDGSGHALGNGFTYTYTSGTADYGTFTLTTGGATRFKYGYTNGQWQHYGADSAWADLGNASLSASFMGDGSAHALGTVWWFTYNPGSGATDDQGQFSLSASGNNRFAYRYGPGRWLQYGGGTWGVISGLAVSADFIGDGTTHDIGDFSTHWYFTYDAMTGPTTDWGRFSLSATGDSRFAYDYNGGQWFQYDVGASGWVALGDAAGSPKFIGDGEGNSLGVWHTPGTGTWYFTYDAGSGAADDKGRFSLASWTDYRFAYGYNDGQWFHFDVGGSSWVNLGGTTSSLASFIGDGFSHDLGTGWWFTYNAGTGFRDDQGQWSLADGARNRFAYGYNEGQWFHFDVGGLNWVILGGTASSLASFMGDGSSHDLGTGWWFTYNAGTGFADDQGQWSLADGVHNRFAYGYNDGQWFHYDGCSGWVELGDASAALADFIGDGFAHNLGTWKQPGTGNWFFTYDAATGRSTDKGQFSLADGSDYRFAYGYNDAQWFHYDVGCTSWVELGDATASPGDFIGDGLSHNLGTWNQPGTGNWWFTYNAGTGATDDKGQFSLADGFDHRFAYGYNDGQWFHWGAGGWAELGAAGTSVASFMGDGSAHDLGTWNQPGTGNWYFTYNAGTGFSDDQGQFSLSPSGDNRFAYRYFGYQWRQYGAGAWEPLSCYTQYADFIGDGAPHDFYWSATHWYFRYNAGTGATDDQGQFSFSFSGDNRFAYRYSDALWFHYDVGGSSWEELGDSGASPYFIGDGSAHNLGTWHQPGTGNWFFTYNAGTGFSDDQGQFSLSASGNNRFAYGYNDGQWFQYELGTWSQLGDAAAELESFIGDCLPHNLGTWKQPGSGNWFFTYDAGSGATDDQGQFSRSASGDNRFAYRFSDAQWFDYDVGASSWVPLGDPGASPAFIGDGNGHNLGTWWQPGSGHWYFTYDAGTGSSNDKGRFGLWSSGDYRFAYGYNSGQWQFDQYYTGWTSIGGGSQSLLNFIGDGSAHTLYTGAKWTLQYNAADDRLVITQIAGGYQYLAYGFAGPYWMDGGLGYALAPITGGSSPYWLTSTDSSTLYLTSSAGKLMKVDLSVDTLWSVEYYSGTTPLWQFAAEIAEWYQWGGTDWVDSGPGAPWDHRQ